MAVYVSWVLLHLLLCMWLLSSFCLASSAPSPSYNFVHLHSCPACEAQYGYDFTTAVQLALDNLERSNGALGSGSGSGHGEAAQIPLMGIGLQVRYSPGLQQVPYLNVAMCSYSCNHTVNIDHSASIFS